MTLTEIQHLLKELPNTPPEDGQILFDFILKGNINTILELGFNHGTSTCYMAAALREKGAGKIITIDRHEAKKMDPNIETLAQQCGLAQFIEPRYVHTSYTWELKSLIESQSREGLTAPLFDFCFLDGAHTWETDGLAFYLVDKLLKPGGWLLFDDLDWSFANSYSLKNTPEVLAMPEDERTTPQMEEVFRLLVAQHPDYINLRRDSRWGWAQKKPAEGTQPAAKPEGLTEIYNSQSILPDIKVILRKLRSRFYNP